MRHLKSLALSALLLPVSLGIAWGFAELANLQEGGELAGYRTESLYLDAAGEPMGARFLHPNGMIVDLIRFASVPQVSLNFGSLPTSDMGEPHTQEHLLLGKGKVGAYLNSLISMSLARHTASTPSELTNYQFYTAAGKETFYDLLRAFLGALIKPDYTDEEIRREVAHFGVAEYLGSGSLRLAEKGTVYNEMVSWMEKRDWVNWYQLSPRLFGEKSPLALNQAGDPDAIWRLTPEDIRRFHAANYHFGSNLELIAALPPDYSGREFLEELSDIMDAVEPAAAKAKPGCRPSDDDECLPYARLPGFHPGGKDILIGKFPSADTSLPVGALLAWKPLAKPPAKREKLELELFLGVLAGGDSSVLYRQLIDEKTRSFDSGAAAVGSWFQGDPANVPIISLDGMPSSKITEEKLRALRQAVLKRIRSISKAGKRSEELKEFNAKALSLLKSRRRAALKFIDSPPRFGFRQTGTQWHSALRLLHREKGFRKPLAMAAVFDEVEARLRKKNVWKEVVRRNRLNKEPFVSAVLPDASLLAEQRAAKEQRLSGALLGLLERFKTEDEQQALAAFKDEFDAETAKITAAQNSIGRPGFVKNPPLTLDETIDWEQSELLPGVDLVTSRFPSTPFTDIYLLFNLRGLSRRELRVVSVLPSLLSSLGVSTRGGEKLDYAKMEERWRAEIHGLSAGVASNGRSGRVELSLVVSGASPAENAKALEWLENCLLRPDLSQEIAGRLRAVLRGRIQGLRNLFQGSEESWAREVAGAYVYQNDPLWMSANSPFTQLHQLSRVYFRLSGFPDGRTRGLVQHVLADLAKGSQKSPRQRMAERFSRLAAGGLPKTNPAAPFLKDFGEYLSVELGRLPEGSWRDDLGRLINQVQADLSVDPAVEMRVLAAVLKKVVVRSRVRAALTGNPENTAALRPGLESLVRSFPEGKPAPARPPGRPEVFRRLKTRLKKLTRRPVHVGLVNNGAKSGVLVLSARGPSYQNTGSESAYRHLAAEVFSGAAPHTFFLKTWHAGLAYSNGVSASPQHGRVLYYAERSPDLEATMRFVAGLAKNTRLDDRFFVDFALANSFSDYRGGDSFSARGSAMVSDIADGNTPEKIRKYKTALINAAAAPDALEKLRRQLPRVLGSVLVGYGKKMAQTPEAVGFAIGPDDLLDRYADFLKKSGEADRLIKLYPRDFWLLD